MKLLWIGTPKSQLLKRVTADHFVITHDLRFFEYHASTSLLTPLDLPVNRESIDGISNLDLLSRLPYLIDIWSRWDICSQLSLEKLLQRSHCIVSSLTIALASLKIDKVFACYATPHHLWNNLVELACELEQIPVLHLYPFLELDISIPIFGNNHNISSFPEAAPDHEWSRYTSFKVASYVDRIKQIAFSPESKRCFQHRFRSPIAIGYYRYLRILKSYLSSSIKRSIPYRPLSYAGLTDNPLSTLLALHHIQDTQDRAISFYLRNVDTFLNLTPQTDSVTFLLIGHVQPEASTSPMGVVFYSQIKVAQYIRSKCANCRIFYREHPGSFYSILPGGHETLVGISRSIFYYKELLSLGVQFMPVGGNVISLLKRYPHLIPVTITGSVALEAPVSVASPCIYFGEPYWQGFPGSIHYKNVNWLNIAEQFKAIRSSPDILTHASIQWLEERASLNCVPNTMGYGISSKEILFPKNFYDLFYSRLNNCLSG